MERLSLRSFVAHGHEVWLWTYGDVGEVPAGVVRKQGEEILPASRIFRYRDFDTVAGFSNLFRYALLLARGGTWSDSDVVCLRPLPDAPYLIPSEDHHDGGVQRANCVLRAPAGSDFLRLLRDRSFAVPPAEMEWGQTGPKLVHSVAAGLGLPWLQVRAFCPVPYFRWERLATAVHPAQGGSALDLTEDSFGVHLWHELWRRAGRTLAQAEPGSLAAALLRRYP
jgi:hypothetical protein